MTFTALSIAGSDPSGGAGIQADLKTFSARGVYGMAALTALTAQNTTGVSGVHLVPAAFVAQQIHDVFADLPVGAVKVGMIAVAEIAEAVAAVLEGCDSPIVLDPVMIAKGGHPLLAQSAVVALRRRLLPLADVLTPNLPEAAALLEQPVAQDRATMVAHGRALLALGPKAVLMKGGHLEADDSPDALITREGVTWYAATRTATQNTHGTGCTLSAALAAELAKGRPLKEAVDIAKSYLGGAIAAADSLTLGAGHGPIHHFHALWPVVDAQTPKR
jgi:hydroxymethylpyrimidine/phosphomethylpyrimidine kinase